MIPNSARAWQEAHEQRRSVLRHQRDKPWFSARHWPATSASEEEPPEQVAEAEEDQDHDRHHGGDQPHHRAGALSAPRGPSVRQKVVRTRSTSATPPRLARQLAARAAAARPPARRPPRSAPRPAASASAASSRRLQRPGAGATGSPQALGRELGADRELEPRRQRASDAGGVLVGQHREAGDDRAPRRPPRAAPRPAPGRRPGCGRRRGSAAGRPRRARIRPGSSSRAATGATERRGRACPSDRPRRPPRRRRSCAAG